MATVVLLPQSVLGQGWTATNIRCASWQVTVRGYLSEAFFILDELGDYSVAAGDTAGAIEAYRHAAWIAAEAARGANVRFNPKILGWADESERVRSAVATAERVLSKAVALGGPESAAVAPLRIDRNLEDWGVGLEVGRILHALGQPETAIRMFEIVGDEALAGGDAELAERAYREGWLLAYEEYLRLSLQYNPMIQATRTNFIPMRNAAARLAEKAKEALAAETDRSLP